MVVMVGQTTSAPFRAATLRKVVVLWWALSVASSLLVLQPFEALLGWQTATAGVAALDPFVLLVAVEREQQALSAALGTATVFILATKLCAQLPLSLTLVLLANDATCRSTATLRTLEALPYVTFFSLLADGLPFALLYVVSHVTGGLSFLLAAPGSTVGLLVSLACVLFLFWLMSLTLFDFAKIAGVTTRRRPSLWHGLQHAARVFAQAPVRSFVQSTLARTAAIVCLAVGVTVSLRVVQTGSPWAAWLGWFVTQASVVLSQYCRVMWLAAATQRLRAYDHLAATTEHIDAPRVPSPSPDA